MEELKFKIDGMTCEGCVKRAAAALKGVRGVQSAEVDLASDEGSVRFEAGQVDPQTCIDALEDIGFDAKQI